jgi:SH3-like domain-containing protein
VKSTKPDGPAPDASKLPRYAALKFDTVNLRVGPGTRYPIQAVYNRKDLPVLIEREFEVWRGIRDPDGVVGWVHVATLTARRGFIVTGADATIRADRKDTASAVAVLRVGVVGRLRACEAGSNWCEIRVGGHKGYLRRDQFWGLLPDETIKP